MTECKEIAFSFHGNILSKVNTARDHCPSRVVIPEGVEEIGFNAFSLCEEVGDIILPKSLRKIQYGAFMGCKKITTLEMPEGVTEIGPFAFLGCDSLREVKLSKNTQKIHQNAFHQASILKVEIPAENAFYVFQDGLLLNKERTNIVECVDCKKTEIVVPEGVKEIEERAFSHCQMSKVSLPASLTCIQAEAFQHCVKLIEIEIPNGVTFIGKKAFGSCLNLSRVVLPTGIAKISQELFVDCKKLQQIILPSNIKSIQNAAFAFCSSLSSVKICSSEIEILEKAFKNCNRLEEIVLPPVTKRIGNCAFYGCTSLVKVSCDFTNTEYVGYRAFQHAPWFAQMNLSTAGAVCIDGVLFSSPDQEISIVSNTVRVIAGGAFHGKKKLKQVTIPGSVKTIGPNAFSACRDLEMVNLSKGLRRIERNAFRRCYELRTLHIPDTVECIDDYAFQGCYHLSLVKLDGHNIRFGAAVFTKPSEEIIFHCLTNNKPLLSTPMVEAVAYHLPAHYAINVFGIGAVLGFCRASLNGTVFSSDIIKVYEQYLKRNKNRICESVDQNEIAIIYMQKNSILC